MTTKRCASQLIAKSATFTEWYRTKYLSQFQNVFLQIANCICPMTRARAGSCASELIANHPPKVQLQLPHHSEITVIVSQLFCRKMFQLDKSCSREVQKSLLCPGRKCDQQWMNWHLALFCLLIFFCPLSFFGPSVFLALSLFLPPWVQEQKCFSWL